MGAAILQDLVVVMVVAAATTILCYRLRQPVVLGYLLAGLLVGPHTPPFQLVSDAESVHGLAELGIIFLMFALGLEFNLRKLRDVGLVAVVAATVEIGIMLLAGYHVGMWMGWGPMNSIFLGAIVSISSTTIIVKVLMERGEMQEKFAEVVFGILIVEDIVAVALVALLSGFGSGTLDASLLGSVLGRLVLFVLIAVAVGIVLVPRLIDWVSRFHVEEVLIITVVGLALSGALVALKLGFSLALGAFLVGAIVAESRAVRRVEHKIVPIRDIFTAVFFVAVGMLIDPRVVVAYAGPILIVTCVTVVGKVAGCTLGTLVAGREPRTSLRVGMTLAQIGEFSFIIAAFGLTLGIMDPFLYPVAVTVSALTAFLSPYLARVSDRVATRIGLGVPAPLAALGTGYRRALARVAVAHAERAKPHAERHGARVLIYAAWLLALFIAGGYASLWFGDRVPERISVGNDLKRAGGLLLIGLLGLPFFAAFTKATEAWAHELAKARSYDPRRLARADLRYLGPRFAARVVAVVAAAGLLTLALRVSWGVHPFAFPRPWLLVPSLVLVAGAGYLAWQRSHRLYAWMEETLDTLLDDSPDAAQPLQRLRERYPWGVDVEEVPVLSSSWGAYTSLRDLDLRERTGATVLNVERGNAIMPNPHPDMALLPGDRVVLVGKREQLDRAARLLHERGAPSRSATRRAPRHVTEELRVPPSSPAVGVSLAALGVKERTGANVAGLTRRDGAAVHPAPATRIASGDQLLVAGSPDALKRVRELFHIRDAASVPRR